MNKDIDISIIIPIYNRAYGIEECISSIRLNDLCSYLEIEVLICDDHSSDNIAKVVEGIKSKYPRINISLIQQKVGKKGANLARGNGVKHARGKYIVFLDSDDYIINDSIMKRYNYLQKADVDLVYGNAITRHLICKYDDITNTNQKQYMMEELSLCPFSVIMVRRETIESIDWDDINIPAWQDDAFIAEVIMKGGTVGHCGEIIAEMEVSSDSISKSNDKKMSGCCFMVEKYKKEILKYSSIKRLIWWRERIIISRVLNRKEETDDIGYIFLSEVLKQQLNRHFRHIWG